MNKLLSSEYFLVFLGGGLGSLLRYAIGSGLELSLGSTLAGVLSLFFVNVTGAFFLGIVSFHPFFSMKTENHSGDQVLLVVSQPCLVLPCLFTNRAVWQLPQSCLL
jgi:fluoride ion exporter CrcB/FEX